MGNVGWGGIIIAGWPVLSILAFASVVTIAVIWERWKTYKKIQVDSKTFIDSLRRSGSANQIITFCERSHQPLAIITKNIYKAPAKREMKERILHRSIQSLVQHLERHVSILGTIASVAPFVGLLGTVIGIIKAFRAISMTSGGTAMVAVGIAEALVGTAAGLVVAIPALLGYNYFVNRLRHLSQEWELAGAEIVDLALAAQGGNQ